MRFCVCVCVCAVRRSIIGTDTPSLPRPLPRPLLTSWLCSTRASPRALARAALCVHVPVRMTDLRAHCPLNGCRSCAPAPINNTCCFLSWDKNNMSWLPTLDANYPPNHLLTTLARSPSHHASLWPPHTLPMVQTRVAHRGETTSAKSMDDLEMKIATLEQAVRSGVIGSGAHQVSSTPFCTHALQLACD
jgi:hypothetical protein